MSLLDQFLCGAISLEQLGQDASQKVRWAANPIKPGEIPKAQINRAWRELRELDHGVVRRAWYGICGPKTYPQVENAWLKLLERRANEQHEIRALAERITELEEALERTRQDQDADEPMAGSFGGVGIPAPGKG